MIARAHDEDFFAAFDRLPVSEAPLTPEEEEAFASAEARAARGESPVVHAEVERQIEERRRTEGG